MSLMDAVWPRDTPQSECALAALEIMEEKGIIPEASTHEILLRVCVSSSFFLVFLVCCLFVCLLLSFLFLSFSLCLLFLSFLLSFLFFCFTDAGIRHCQCACAQVSSDDVLAQKICVYEPIHAALCHSLLAARGLFLFVCRSVSQSFIVFFLSFSFSACLSFCLSLFLSFFPFFSFFIDHPACSSIAVEDWRERSHSVLFV